MNAFIERTLIVLFSLILPVEILLASTISNSEKDSTATTLEHQIFSESKENSDLNSKSQVTIKFVREIGGAGLDCPLAVAVNGIFEGELKEDGSSFTIKRSPNKYQISASYRCSGMSNIFRTISDYNMRSQSLDAQPGTDIVYTLTSLCVRNRSRCENSNPVVIPSIHVSGETELKFLNLRFEGTSSHPIDLRFEYRIGEKTFQSPKFRIRSESQIAHIRRNGSYSFFASLAGKRLGEIEQESGVGSELLFQFKVPTLELPQRVLSRLDKRELIQLESENIVNTIADESYGSIIDVQGQDLSTPGSTMGSFLGAEYARRQFNDQYLQNQFNRIDQGKSVQPYNSSASMRAQLLGAIAGSGSDTAATSRYRYRYSIRTGDSKIITRDVISQEPFRIARGTCVNLKDLEPVQQQICEWSLDNFRSALFGQKDSQIKKPDTKQDTVMNLADRLKQLKDLYDQSLISKDQYDAQVRHLLNSQ